MFLEVVGSPSGNEVQMMGVHKKKKQKRSQKFRVEECGAKLESKALKRKGFLRT